MEAWVPPKRRATHTRLHGVVIFKKLKFCLCLIWQQIKGTWIIGALLHAFSSLSLTLNSPSTFSWTGRLVGTRTVWALRRREKTAPAWNRTPYLVDNICLYRLSYLDSNLICKTGQCVDALWSWPRSCVTERLAIWNLSLRTLNWQFTLEFGWTRPLEKQYCAVTEHNAVI